MYYQCMEALLHKICLHLQNLQKYVTERTCVAKKIEKKIMSKSNKILCFYKSPFAKRGIFLNVPLLPLDLETSNSMLNGEMISKGETKKHSHATISRTTMTWKFLALWSCGEMILVCNITPRLFCFLST